MLLRKNLELIDIISNEMNGNILLRDKQYNLFHDPKIRNTIAKTCISNKIINQELLLKKIRAKDEVLKKTHQKLHSLAASAAVSENNKQLLGIE